MSVLTAPLTTSIASLPEQKQEEEEIELALLALTGWICHQCKQILRPSADFVCCYWAHCPFCGAADCEHRVAHRRRGYRDPDRKLTLRGIVIPARKMPKGPTGAPLMPMVLAWSHEERQSHFGSSAPYLEAFFGTDLQDEWSSRHIKQILFDQVVHPERHVAIRDAWRHAVDTWFCREGAIAQERAHTVLTDLQAGLRTLKSLSAKSPQKESLQ